MTEQWIDNTLWIPKLPSDLKTTADLGLGQYPRTLKMIKASLRGLRGKAQLFPSDVSTILQAHMDVSDNMIALRERLDAIETRTADDTSTTEPAEPS